MLSSVESVDPDCVEPVESLRQVPEVRLGLASGALLLCTAVCVGLQVPTLVAAVGLCLQTGLSCLVLQRRDLALMLGVTGWALCTSFLVNQLGELTFAPHDLARLTVFAGWALTCRWLGATQ